MTGGLIVQAVEDSNSSSMDTCWHSCIKYIIVIFNLLLALAGLAIIGVGTYIQIGAKHYLDFLDSSYLNTPIVFIIVGNYKYLK